MFKKFEAKDIGNTNQMKSSVQRGIRSKLIERYPKIEEHIDTIMPKKAVVKLVKCHDHIELIEIDNEIVFFQQRDDGPYPTLKVFFVQKENYKAVHWKIPYIHSFSFNSILIIFVNCTQSCIADQIIYLGELGKKAPAQVHAWT